MRFKSPNPLTNLPTHSPVSCNECSLCDQDLLRGRWVLASCLKSDTVICSVWRLSQCHLYVLTSFSQKQGIRKVSSRIPNVGFRYKQWFLLREKQSLLNLWRSADDRGKQVQLDLNQVQMNWDFFLTKSLKFFLCPICTKAKD